jgi:hypothetical protein
LESFVNINTIKKYFLIEHDMPHLSIVDADLELIA